MTVQGAIDASPLFRMEGVSKRYGGVRALERAELTVAPGRIHADPGRERRRQIHAHQGYGGSRAAGRGPHDDGRARGALSRPCRRQCRRHRLHISGIVADPRAQRRRQRRHLGPAAALRHDRPRRAAEGRTRCARPRRRRGHPSEGTRQGSAAVPPADGGDRQGAGAQAAHPDPRRGDVGAHRRRRGEGVPGVEAPALRRSGAPLHLAPHARDRRACRRVHGLPQRPQRRDLQGRHQDRQRSGRDDDRPRIQSRLPAQADGDAERQAAGARGAQPHLGRPAARHLLCRSRRRDRRPRRSRRPGAARRSCSRCLASCAG